MQAQFITRQQVIELAQKMPLEKLARWYEYGLFIQARPILIPQKETTTDDALQDELTAWEAASDEDWFEFEEKLAKVA